MSFSVAYTAPAGAHAPSLYRQSHTCPQGFANSHKSLKPAPFFAKGAGFKRGFRLCFASHLTSARRTTTIWSPPVAFGARTTLPGRMPRAAATCLAACASEAFA